MLPRPMTPSVLPRSSLPRNFFFSHLPDLVEALACGIAPSKPEHERDRMLGDRNRIAARRVHDEYAGCGGGGQIDVVHADAGAADDLELRRLRKTSAFTFTALRTIKASVVGRCCAYSFGLETITSQPGWAFSKSIPAAARGSATSIFMLRIGG